MSWWVTDALDKFGPIYLVSVVFWVIFSITLHEIGHGVAAVWEGDSTPIKAGHMNMNPLVHMGGYSLLIFALVGIAWGAMPVTPYRFRHGRYGEVLVAAAGPLVNLTLAIISSTLLAFALVFMSPSPFLENISQFLGVGGIYNIVLLMLNLIPVPPLDGSHILGGFFQPARRLYERSEVQQFAFFGLVIIMLSGGVGRMFIMAVDVNSWWVSLIVALLPG